MGETASCCNTTSNDNQELQGVTPAQLSIQTVKQFEEKYPLIKRRISELPPYVTNVDKSKFYTFNNNIYFGMVKNGKCEGKGIMLYEEGYLYEGEWKNGLRNGYGRMIDRNGQVYEGQWLDNEPNGEGTYQNTQQKCTYRGMWKNGKMHGQGSESFSEGSYYEGTFVDSQKEGNGKIVYSDGSVYEGEFKNNVPEGFGILLGLNHKYEGTFKNGLIDGYGKSQWYDEKGDVVQRYEGGYLEGKKHGIGQHSWGNKVTFKGKWEHGDIAPKASTSL